MKKQEIRDHQFAPNRFAWIYQNITSGELTLPISLLLLFCENKNPSQGPLVKCVFISGTVDLQGCVHRFHSQEVGLYGPCPEDLVEGCDGGNPQETAVCG